MSGGEVPVEWTCADSSYGASDGCDCNCGAIDPDCEISPDIIFGCTAGQVCFNGVCTSRVKAVPTSWTCPIENFGTLDGCHCECGDVGDPDCQLASQQVFNCKSGQRCIAGACIDSGGEWFGNGVVVVLTTALLAIVGVFAIALFAGMYQAQRTKYSR